MTHRRQVQWELDERLQHCLAASDFHGVQILRCHDIHEPTIAQLQTQGNHAANVDGEFLEMMSCCKRLGQCIPVPHTTIHLLQSTTTGAHESTHQLEESKIPGANKNNSTPEQHMVVSRTAMAAPHATITPLLHLARCIN